MPFSQVSWRHRSSSSPARAQPVTGVPGSPSATTTIDGKQLPPPPQKFGGKIERNAALSKPYWPPRVVPPKGAPNDADYQVPFRFTGKLDKLTLTIDRPKLSPDGIKKLEQAERNNRASEGGRSACHGGSLPQESPAWVTSEPRPRGRGRGPT
jgi:hypothetical protein